MSALKCAFYPTLFATGVLSRVYVAQSSSFPCIKLYAANVLSRENVVQPPNSSCTQPPSQREWVLSRVGKMTSPRFEQTHLLQREGHHHTTFLRYGGREMPSTAAPPAPPSVFSVHGLRWGVAVERVGAVENLADALAPTFQLFVRFRSFSTAIQTIGMY